MGKFYILFHLVLADFRERTRRYSFLMIILANLFLAYQVYIGNFTPRLGMHRGANNTAWVGASITCTCTIMLVIFGFYLIKNSLSRDLQSGVGQILAGTRLSKLSYLFGKVLSNFTVLAVIVAIIATFATLMVLIQGWEGSFDLWQLIAPFLFICLPPMFLVAALAVLFESIRFLRGGYGNLIYFVAIVGTLPLGIEPAHPILDFMGFGLFVKSMEKAALLQYPGADVGFNLNPEHIANLKVFLWDGIDWSVDIVSSKFALIGAAILVTLLAAMVFDRFDPSRKAYKAGRFRGDTSLPSIHEPSHGQVSLDVHSRSTGTLNFSLFPIVLGELKLMLKGQHKIWYGLVLGLIIAQMFAPFGAVRAYLLPITWAMPILIWSSMGVRDRLYGCRELMISIPYSEGRMLVSNWIAGALVALLTASGALLHSVVIGDFHYLAALIIGAAFIPTLALSLGLMSRTSRLFETVYAVIWYVGLLNHMPQLDFAGAVAGSFESGISYYFLAISIVLMASVYLFKKVRVGVA